MRGSSSFHPARAQDWYVRGKKKEEKDQKRASRFRGYFRSREKRWSSATRLLRERGGDEGRKGRKGGSGALFYGVSKGDFTKSTSGIGEHRNRLRGRRSTSSTRKKGVRKEQDLKDQHIAGKGEKEDWAGGGGVLDSLTHLGETRMLFKERQWDQKKLKKKGRLLWVREYYKNNG